MSELCQQCCPSLIRPTTAEALIVSAVTSACDTDAPPVGSIEQR